MVPFRIFSHFLVLRPLDACCMRESLFENNEGRQGWRVQKRLVRLEGHEALIRVDYHRRWSCIANARDAREADLSHGALRGEHHPLDDTQQLILKVEDDRVAAHVQYFHRSRRLPFPWVGPLPSRKGALFVPRGGALNVSDF